MNTTQHKIFFIYEINKLIKKKNNACLFLFQSLQAINK